LGDQRRGAIGDAFQGLVDAFGEDNVLEALTLALLVTGPQTIVTGSVLGGNGPDLAELLIDEGVLPETLPLTVPNPMPPPATITLQIPVGEVRAGGLINNPAVLYPAQTGGLLGLIPIGATATTPPTSFNILLPSFFTTLQSLLGAVTDLINPPEDPPASADLMSTNNVERLSINSVETSTERLVTLDVTPDLGVEARGKGAAADLVQLPSNATDGLEKAAAGATNAAGGALDAVEDTLTTARSKGPEVRDSVKFVPETKASSKGGNSGGGLTAISDTISSTGKSFGDAVSSAVKSVTGIGDK
jgi:hypothetical protein